MYCPLLLESGGSKVTPWSPPTLLSYADQRETELVGLGPAQTL